MTDRWEKVGSVFGAARALEGEARVGFLDIACRNDEGLRKEVEALLVADHPTDVFLAKPAFEPIADFLRRTADGLTQGQVLKERYVVQDELSAGGQARVYTATDRVLSRSVVIKVMHAAGGSPRLLTSRFDAEMRALARIDHPGVVGILDMGELEDRSPFLVIQHIQGESLRQILERGPIPRERAANILRQLGAALHAAHAAGVSHRDVKPENVMLQPTPDGDVVKLIDFGLAKIDRSALDPRTTTVMIAGTVRYMAPEQFGGDHSAASDVYSLAVVACEMIAGQPDVRALRLRGLSRTRRLIEAALAFKPEDRPTDVQAWASQLATALTRRRWAGVPLAVGAATAAALFFLVSLSSSFVRSNEIVRVIEKVGAFDPVAEGFQIHNGLRGTVARNAAGDGYEGWQVRSSRAGGYYFRKLTNTQKRLAMDRGWTLNAELRAEQGMAFAVVDFVRYGKRFDIEVYSDGDVDRVLLQTQIVPSFEGLEFRLPGPSGAYHQYELRFDPGLQAAALWVDGIKRLDGYRGHSQFQDDMGLFFGAGPYKGDLGAGSFKSVRFEIHP